MTQETREILINELIIQDFSTGVSESPHQGFSAMRNIDISSVKGVAKINNDLQRKDDGNTDANYFAGYTRWLVRDPQGTVYGINDAGELEKSATEGLTWSIVTGLDTTSARGNGLAFWHDYVFVARDKALDIFGPFREGEEACMHAGIQTLTEDYYHPMFIGSDDVLYIGNGKNLSSITTTGTFSSLTASYTWTAIALDIPTDEHITCLNQLGDDLLLGTYKGKTPDYVNKTMAHIYPWDRVADSYSLPIEFMEAGVWGIAVKDNYAYTTVGNRGNVYRTNGSSASLFKKLPLNLTLANNIRFMPGANTAFRDKLLIGVSTGLGSTLECYGVWSIDFNSGVTLMENTNSRGTYTGTTLYIGALLPMETSSVGYIAGWLEFHVDGGTSWFGIDTSMNSQLTNDYNATIITPMYQVGLIDEPTIFSLGELILDRPLASGQAVRLSYRRSLADSFTQVKDFTYTTYTALQNIRFEPLLPDLYEVQFKIDLETDSGVSTTPHLKQIKLKK